MQPADESHDQVLEEAAEWLVRTEADEMDEAAWRHLEAWRERSHRHERAWQAALRMRSLMEGVPAALGQEVLSRRRLDRRLAIKTIVATLMVPAAGWGGYQHLPWRAWSADHRTATGEQLTVTLPDGGTLILNTDTAVDIHFGERRREVSLQRGEIMVHTAPDTRGTSRPFIVTTPHGRIRALGTQFTVRRTYDATDVTVLSDAVAVSPAMHPGERRVETAQAQRFSAVALEPPRPAARQAAAWTHGHLSADNQRLEHFIAELSRYRPGILRVAPAVRDLRISGVFRLEDTDRILALIEETLPVSIHRITDYWVTLAAR